MRAVIDIDDSPLLLFIWKALEVKKEGISY